MNKGIGSVLGIMDAVKRSSVWERGERIMNFSKSEKACGEISPSLPPFSVFNFLSLFSLVSILSSFAVFNIVGLTLVFLLTFARSCPLHPSFIL